MPEPEPELNDAAGQEAEPHPDAHTWKEMLIGIGIIWAGEMCLLLGFEVISVLLGKMGLKKPPNCPVYPAVLVIQSIFSFAWVLAVVWFLACRRFRKNFFDGMVVKHCGALVVISSATLGLGFAAAAMLISVMWGREDTAIAQIGATPAGLAALCCVAIPGALIEEIYYRGFIFPALRKTLGAAAAVVMIVSWFTLIHVPQLIAFKNGAPAGFDIASLCCIAAAGIIFTLQRHYTDSLLPSIIAHVTYNAVLLVTSVIHMIVSSNLTDF